MKKIIIILFIISLSTRLFFLFNGHNGITHDEADFYYNGYLVSQTGSDIYSNKLFFTTGIISATPNIPVYISSLFWHIVDKTSVIVGRMPFSLINSITPVLLTLLIWRLSGNLIFSLLAFCIINFSPWFLNISSTAGFDSPIALFFVLCSVFSLLTVKNNILKKIFFVLFNFLAFNSYMGYRIISSFSMMFQLILVHWSVDVKNIYDKKVIKKYFKYMLISILLFAVFLIPTLIFPNSNLLKTRSLNENVFTNKETIADVMWYASETSSSQFIGRVFSNKLFTPFALFLKSWLNTFNFSSIFGGETHPIYGMRILGLFFMTDIFLLLLGLIVFKEYFPKKLYPIFLIFAFGGLPFAISPQGVTIALRGLILIIPYSLLIANGYYYLFLKHKKIFIFSIIIFSINIMSVLLLYSYRIKVLSSETFHSTDRTVIEELSKSEEIVYIFPGEFKPFVLLYAFYSQDDPKSVKAQLSNDALDTFVNKKKDLYIYKYCKDYKNIKKGSLVLIRPTECKQEGVSIIKSYISQDRSGEVLYNLIRK